MAIDKLISKLSAINASKKEFKGELYRTGQILLLKPNTFMNLSGESVEIVKNYFKIDNVIVIHDEIELPVGALRFKKGGGHAGHNGLRSIDKHIGADYYRVRVGIGKPEHKGQIADYCLSDFAKAEKDAAEEILEIAADAALELTKSDLSTICSNFTKNQKIGNPE
jgi:peptidyl-tRNA hydrolase, PTH1 family